jgi:hypothetical protein
MERGPRALRPGVEGAREPVRGCIAGGGTGSFGEMRRSVRWSRYRITSKAQLAFAFSRRPVAKLRPIRRARDPVDAVECRARSLNLKHSQHEAGRDRELWDPPPSAVTVDAARGFTQPKRACAMRLLRRARDPFDAA